jgi:hypothetical protein
MLPWGGPTGKRGRRPSKHWRSIRPCPFRGLLSRPDFSDAEQRLHEELMRKAGFSLCAQLEGLAEIEKPYRLPDAPPLSHAPIPAPPGTEAALGRSGS